MYTEQVGNFIFPSELAAVLSGNMCKSGIFMVVGQKYAGVCSLSLFPSHQFTNKTIRERLGMKLPD